MTADIFGVTVFLAKFAEAIPMFLQAVMSIRLCQTFDKVPTAFAANNLGRKTAWFYDAMRRRIEFVAFLVFFCTFSNVSRRMIGA